MLDVEEYDVERVRMEGNRRGQTANTYRLASAIR